MAMAAIRANGLEFACLEEGRGPLVLLLHGFPDTAHTWDATRLALAAAGFRAVSPFMRGYAPTALPADGDYRLETLGRDVAELIEALGEGEAIVIGHDWGAAAAYVAATRFPERVRALVTVAIPHPRSVRPSLGLAWKARHFVTLRFGGAAERLRKGGFAGVDALVRRWSPAWDPPPSETEAVKRAFSEPGCLDAALGYYRAVSLRPPRGLFGPVRAPALAFAGATDFAIGPEAYERARPWYQASYEVITLPGGHFLHREHPVEFHGALVPRLRSLTTATGPSRPASR